MSTTTSAAGGAAAGAAAAGATLYALKHQIEAELRASVQQSLDEARAQIAHERDELHAAVAAAKSEVEHAQQAAAEALAHSRTEAEQAVQHAIDEATAKLAAAGHDQEVQTQHQVDALLAQHLLEVQARHEELLATLQYRFDQLGHDADGRVEQSKTEVEQATAAAVEQVAHAIAEQMQLLAQHTEQARTAMEEQARSLVGQVQSQVEGTEAHLAELSRDVLGRVEDEGRRHHSDISEIGERFRRDLEHEADQVRERKLRFRAVVEDLVQGIAEQVPVVGHALAHLADRIDPND